jgi:hypothetical protein
VTAPAAVFLFVSPRRPICRREHTKAEQGDEEATHGVWETGGARPAARLTGSAVLRERRGYG